MYLPDMIKSSRPWGIALLLVKKGIVPLLLLSITASIAVALSMSNSNILAAIGDSESIYLPLVTTSGETTDYTPHQQANMDWSLPEWVQTSQTGSAWGSSYPESEDEPAYIRVGFIAVDWKTINPLGDVFDFSSIESELNKQKRPVVIRINWYGACAAPSWVLSDANSLQSKTLVFWDQAYRDALTPLVNAFASSYANDNRIEGVYMGFADGHREIEGDCDSDENGWGEFSRSGPPRKLLKQKQTSASHLAYLKVRRVRFLRRRKSSSTYLPMLLVKIAKNWR